MRTRLLIGTLFLSILALPVAGLAQETADVSAPTTQQEEAQGKAILERLQAKKITCDKISDTDFELLGEYFMGRMLGDGHEAMNERAKQMMGEQGEEQMHIAMGKRLSECFPAAAFPRGMMGAGMMSWYDNGTIAGAIADNGYGSPMMGRRGTNVDPGSSYPYGQYSMMGYGYNGHRGVGVVLMLIWWAIIITAIVMLVRWLKGKYGNSSLAVLRERYAKGEIDKKEFDEKKKDLA